MYQAIYRTNMPLRIRVLCICHFLPITTLCVFYREIRDLDKNVQVETPRESDIFSFGLLRLDGKKGGAFRQGTPYPKGGKTPASGGKSNKSLKSIGSVPCDSFTK
ncbi:hypothetical protein MKW92_031762 [Papaver armeniacum]|nr:hypothetical protein MKW92_031762 [Papaver armeniacum]